MPRYWKIKNKSPFRLAEISNVGNYQNNLMRLNCFAIANNVPTWKLNFKSKKCNLDQSHILNLLRATSYTKKPTCIMSWKVKGKKVSTKKCRIISSEGLDSGTADSLEKNTVGSPMDGHISLFLKVPNGCVIPSVIKRVKLVINGQLLPKNKFQYAICDSLRADFTACSDYEYLQNPGPAIVPFTGVSDDRNSCSAYLVRPNSNLKSYCKFAVR
jgi:hypothetical protein